MEEFELVVAEEYKFEYGPKWKVALLGKFLLLRHWCKEHKLTFFQSKTSLKFEFLMQNPIEEIKFVRLVNYDFEYREKN